MTSWNDEQGKGEQAQRSWVDDSDRLRAENKRLREALEEINMNANNLLAGGLSWFTRRDFADVVADRSKAALAMPQSSTEVKP